MPNTPTHQPVQPIPVASVPPVAPMPNPPPVPTQAPVQKQVSEPPPLIVPRPEDTRPFDLWGQFEPPPLPRGILPPVLECYVWPVAEQIGCDPAGLAIAAVTACAAAIPDSVKLQVKANDPTWLESARIWSAMVGMPSTKKTPTFSSAMRPIVALDTEKVRAWQAAMAAWEALPKDEQKSTPKPLQVRLALTDTTVEALQEVFRGTRDGVLLYRDELSGWFGAMEKYGGSGGASADRAFYLQSFNGGAYAINRVGRGNHLLENLSASILGGIQPDAIRRVAGGAVDDGLLQRFIPIVLRPAELGHDAPIPPEAGMYKFAVRSMHRVTAAGPLRFDPEAQQVFQEVQRRHHRLGACEAVNRRLGAHIQKLDGIFARLCIVWHVAASAHLFKSTVDPIITADTARQVARFIAEFTLPHAFAFYTGVLGATDNDDDLRDVAGYILAKRLPQVDHRTIKRSVRSCRKLDKFSTRPLFETLAAMGWLTAVDDPDKRNGEPLWFVNPNVHLLFAERAEREEARRLQDRAAIVEMSGRAD